MASPIEFPGCNTLLRGDGDEGTIGDLMIFDNNTCLVSCWELSEEELHEVIRTGMVFASVMTREFYPLMVGSETAVREQVIGTGPVWPRTNLNMPGTDA